MARCSDCFLDPLGELVDRGRVLIDQVQVNPGHERVVLYEASLECLGQRGDLDPQPPPGKVGHEDRIAFAVDESLEHRPTRDTEDVGGHGGELDPGVLQQFLQALHFP